MGPPLKGIYWMNTKDNRHNTHFMIDHIFHDLLPAQGMAERPEQVALSHLMLDALLDGSIALCDIKTLDMIQRYRTMLGKILRKRSISEVFRTF